MMKLLSASDSKQLLSCLLFLFVLFSSFKSIAQNNYSDAFIENCIREVFKDKADELVFNSSSRRLVAIQDFFKNRLEIITYKEGYGNKGMVDLSTIGLSNKYNNQLTRDTSFNPLTFNPLKYQIDIFPGNTKLYKLGNSGYMLIVKPSRNK